MSAGLKAIAKRHWPALRLRTILFGVLLFTAAMPGLGALFLRVYENTLVRQTEAELVAQAAALAATGQALWSGGPPPATPQPGRDDGYRPETSTVDLRSTPVLPERPDPTPTGQQPDLAAVEAARTLDPIIRETTRTTLAAILLLDSRGRIVDGPYAGTSHAALPEVRAALAGRSATTLRRQGGYHPRYDFEWLSRASGLRLHYARPVMVGGQVAGVLLLSRSPRVLFRGLYEDRGKIVFGICLIFGILVVLSGLISRGVTRPIESLSAASRAVSSGRGRIPEAPTTAAVEIQALYQDFRAMAETIARRSRYLRDFAAAVSHEFKTPLAGISGAIELLQDHHDEMLPEERRRFLGNISSDAARLSRLVTRLLDLARADMAAPEAGAAGDPALPARRVADALAGEDFQIRLSLPPTLPAVAVPEATLEAVLTSLIDNSRQAGASSVVIAAEVEPGGLRLTVTDDGPGVAAADRERLFEPFFTSRRAEGGTGLGLPIARSLLAAHRSEIDLGEAMTGTTVVLRLRRAGR